MKFYTLTFILVATVAMMALAEPEPEPAKASRYRAAQIIEDAELDEEIFDNKQKNNAANDAANDNSNKGDASSGRLFTKKFLLFKNMFGNNQQQPIIPIIITGSNAGTAVTPPTTTVTSTATIPSGTGTITTSPVTSPTTSPTANSPTPGAGAGAGKRGVPQLQFAPRDSYENDDHEDNESGSEINDESAVVDEQTLASALAAGAEEYVVTEQEIKGTSDAKAIRGPARVNLRRRGAKRGQVVSVRIPPKYRRFFKNGQRVVLNNQNRPKKRRVIRKRVNRNRNKKNKNKRRRIVAA